MLKALITDTIHPFLQEKLEQNNFVVDVHLNISKPKLLEIIHQYQILIITTYLKIDKDVLDNSKNLKIIARVGSGIENVNTAYATEKNIHVINSPEGNANAVGEHTLAMLLSLLNKINLSNQALRGNIWERETFRGEELDGKTIGIIGFGHTGSAFAKKLSGFDVQILVHDIVPNKHPNQHEIEKLQNECDILSLHVPYTTQTHHLINQEFIEKCTKKPILINTARGAVINTLDVLNALEHEKIKGLCIDVFEDEPITQNLIYHNDIYVQLLSKKNVIATSHIAGWTKESKYKLVKILWDKMQPYLKDLR